MRNSISVDAPSRSDGLGNVPKEYGSLTLGMNRIEDQLIIHCAHVEMNPLRAEAIREILRQDLDWGYVIKIVNRNRIMPLFYHSLSTVPDVILGEPLQRYFKSRFQHNIQYSLLLKSELLKILHQFESRGIVSLPLKGLVLAEAIYGSIALRMCGDLDILVDEADYPEAERIVMGFGYKTFTGSGENSGEPKFQHKYHRGFINEEKGVRLELHWELIERDRGIVQMKDVPSALITSADFGNMSVQVFQPEFLILYLCMHGYKHQWERLSWLCDIAELINTHPTLDWAVVLQQAHKFHLFNVLAMGLFLVEELLDCEIPAAIRSEVPNSPTVVELGKQIEQEIFSESSVQGEARRETDDYLSFNYALLTDPMQRMHLLYNVAIRRIKLTPNERDREWIPLPKEVSFAYFIIRPMRLVYQYSKKYIKTLYRIFRN